MVATTISIQLNHDRLLSVCKTMEAVWYEPTEDKAIKSSRAIFSEVRHKLFKKHFNCEHKKGMFKLKLKIYEAYQLEIFLREWLWGQQPCNIKTCVQLVADEINQKLA